MKSPILALVIVCSLAGTVQAQAPAPADGKALFAKNCAACHQANGRGIPGAFPALVASPVAIGPADAVAEVLLKGRGGMPDFSTSLDDADIAAVLTYARSSWGNRAPPITGAEVTMRRAALQVAPAGDSRFGNKH
ncbi:c-type cytochrome [Massilia aurea]|uniref:c-type cytochrome n=1 Tax=Massilia aurea TaxID=373040 RepID=UPI00216240BB|nr:cytochrome c [Massilia aurea]MCS0705655.1 cytochrome c [Massilia aurea]